MREDEGERRGEEERGGKIGGLSFALGRKKIGAYDPTRSGSATRVEPVAG